MTTRPYLTLDEAKSGLISGGFSTNETMPTDEVLTYRLSQIEAVMNKWFGFRFPETDYIEILKCSRTILLLRQYPVISFDVIEYRLPSMAGTAPTFALSQGLWNGNREVLVYRSGMYRVTYTAGYDESDLSKIQPYLINFLANYEKNNGLAYLWGVAGVVTSVSMPGGISQSKQYLGDLGRMEGRVIDQELMTLRKYKRFYT